METKREYKMDLHDVLPIDYRSLAYIIMFYEGVGNLFPWNAFITASSYYSQRFCGSQFESNFENFFSFTYTLSQTIGLIISVIYQNKISLRNKIIWPLLCYSFIFLITTILVTQTIDPNSLFYVTLLSTCLCGICGAILSGGLFGLGAMFPSSYTGALMSGQGVAGLIVSVASMLTTLAAAPIDVCTDDKAENDDDSCPQDINYSALAYFIISTLILLSCAGAYLVLGRLHFTKAYIARSKKGDFVRESADISSPLIESEEVVNLDADDTIDLQAGGDALTYANIRDLFIKIRIPSLSVWFTFAVTIGLFPSLIVLLESTEKCKTSDRFSNDMFVPFFFLMFNLFDLVGRLTVGATTPIFTANNVWMASLSRLVFFPLFLLCNISGSQLPTWFNHDAFPIIFMILFAFTNGYIASACMMLGPSVVSVKELASAGNIMVLSLTVGLFSGACISFLSVYISQGSI